MNEVFVQCCNITLQFLMKTLRCPVMLVITLVPQVHCFWFILGAAQTAILTPFYWSNHAATVQTISHAIIFECCLSNWTYPRACYCALVRSLWHESYFKIALRYLWPCPSFDIKISKFATTRKINKKRKKRGAQARINSRAVCSYSFCSAALKTYFCA